MAATPDALAEVAMEGEALEAIFLSDYAKGSSNQGPAGGCSLTCKPAAGEDSDANVHVIALLEVGYPADYPSSAVNVGVSSIKGLSEERCEELRAHLESVASTSLGAPMVYSLVDAAKEWLTPRNVPTDSADSMHAKMMARALEKKIVEDKQSAVEASQRAAARPAQVSFAHETPVNAETFNRWLAAYKKETGADKVVAESEKKLTGRQIFEGGAGAELDKMLDTQGGVDMDASDFDAAVFANEEDVSLSDFDDDDEEEDEEYVPGEDEDDEDEEDEEDDDDEGYNEDEEGEEEDAAKGKPGQKPAGNKPSQSGKAPPPPASKPAASATSSTKQPQGGAASGGSAGGKGAPSGGKSGNPNSGGGGGKPASSTSTNNSKLAASTSSSGPGRGGGSGGGRGGKRA